MDLVELLGCDHCEICGEELTMRDIEYGLVAEMGRRDDSPRGFTSKICHTECGEREGLELA